MTREEEILSQAKLITGLFSFRNGFQTPEDAYVSGANWADANPVNPWRKASEELPEPLTYVIVRFSNNTMAVSQRTNHFIGETTTMKVTHWMPIPEIKEER